jgi:phage/plasmid-like protein (TIGR03299 family)
MAHEINITNGRASIALAQKSAWHRLGQVLPESFTAETALREANMDWTVSLQQMFLANGTQVPNKRAVIRDDTSDILGVVGNKYTPLQNRSAFGFFDAVFGEDKARYESAGVLGDGQRVWMLARLPESFDVLPGDAVGQYLLLTNSHDGSAPVTGIFTPIRVVCANTLGQALRSADDSETIRVYHTVNAEARLKLAGELLGKAGVFFNEAKAKFSYLSTIQVGSRDLTKYLTAVVSDHDSVRYDDLSTRSKNVVDEIRNLHDGGLGSEIRGVRGTLWGAYNAVTEYVDHRRTQDNIEYMAVGSGARLKSRALVLASSFQTILN